MAFCRQCGKPLPPQAKGRRRREFCNNAHKQAHYRDIHKPPDDATALARELQVARNRIAELEQRNGGLEQEISHLRYLLDIERRYYEDTQARPFKSWLHQQPPSALIERLFARPGLLPPRGSRGLYEAHLRRLGGSAEEQAELAQLWRRMLVQQS